MLNALTQSERKKRAEEVNEKNPRTLYKMNNTR